MTLFRDVAGNTALSDQLILDLTNFRKGVTAPTDVTIGTSPVTPALLFDAVGELASTFLVMPPTNWDRTVDCSLVLVCELVAVQLNSDVLSWTLDYNVPLTNVTGNGSDKASTQVLATTTVTTANGLAINDPYTITFPMPAADATNPFDPGSVPAGGVAQGFGMEIHLTNTAGVGAIHLVGGCVAYEMLH